MNYKVREAINNKYQKELDKLTKEYQNNCKLLKLSKLKQEINTEEIVMDTTNNHDTTLVVLINIAWNDERFSKELEYILYAIYQRDKEEFEEHYEGQEVTLDNIHEYASDILQNICDDYDLETILHYLGNGRRNCFNPTGEEISSMKTKLSIDNE